MSETTRRSSSVLREKPPTPFGNARTRLRKVAHACYVFIPLSFKWKNRVAHLLYAVTGWIFKGDTNYESWKRKGRIPRLAIEAHPVEDHQLNEVLASVHIPVVPEPLVSIIVLAFGNLQRTLACVRSIHTHLPQVPIELIVVDDASGDLNIERIREVAGLRYVTNEIRLGLLASCNAAARQVRGKYLHFLRHDTEVTAGWLDNMLHLFSTEPDCGMVGSMLVRPDGRVQHAGGIVWKDGSSEHFGRLDSPERSPFKYVREVDFCAAASMLIPAGLFTALNGFDECCNSAGGGEEDLGFRARAAGRRVLYQPRSLVISHEAISSTQEAKSALGREREMKLRRRWAQVLDADHEDRDPGALRAHDRPRRRQLILVVDHFIPQPDRDAGSRSMWCILRALVRMGLAVKFWPQNQANDPEYAGWLQQAGIEVILGEDADIAQWVAANRQRLAYVLLSRPAVAMEFLPLLRKACEARMLFYGHDVHHVRLRREYELTGSRTARREGEEFRKLERSLWRQVDVVYYPSSVETEMVRAAVPGARAYTIPLYFFDESPSVEGPERRKGVLFVAGFGHAPNVDAAKWLLHSIMPRVRAAFPEGVHVWLVGSNPTDEVEALASDDVTVTGYVTDARLHQYYGAGRVAVVPLRFGAGMKGKVIEALHHGIPLVTTPFGAEGLEGLESVIPVSGDECLLAEQICALLRDDEHWKAVSRKQRDYMDGRFSVSAMETALRLGIEDPECSQGVRTLRHVAQGGHK